MLCLSIHGSMSHMHSALLGLPGHASGGGGLFAQTQGIFQVSVGGNIVSGCLSLLLMLPVALVATRARSSVA